MQTDGGNKAYNFYYSQKRCRNSSHRPLKFKQLLVMLGAWELYVLVKQGDPISLQSSLNSLGSDLTGHVNVKFKSETLLTTAIKAQDIRIVEILLKNGADPNLRSSENGRHETPLMTATKWKHLEIVKLLLSYGADAYAQGFYGHDAIFQAVIENSFQILEHFLQQPGSRQEHLSRNCPFNLALKYGENFSSKRQCLWILLRHTYYCCCIRSCDSSSPTPQLFTNESKNFLLVTEKFTVRDREKDALSRILLVENLKLFNLARSAVRESLMKAGRSSISIYHSVCKLPLPKRLKDALLFCEVQEIDLKVHCYNEGEKEFHIMLS